MPQDMILIMHKNLYRPDEIRYNLLAVQKSDWGIKDLNIKISADSTCDLSQELIDRYNIGILPLYINVGDECIRDIGINTEDLFAKVDAGLPCSTAAVNVQDYLDVFGEWLKEYDAIVHFTISSDMSSCYQNACIAAAELGNVYVVDSRTLSSGIGHLAIAAAELAAGGMDAATIKDTLDERKAKLDVSFVLQTLDYLRKGGRCTAVQAFGANLLKLRVSIQVAEGAMGVAKKYRGKMAACYLDYVREKLSDPDSIDPRRIFITDSGISDEDRAAIEAEVRKLVPFEEVYHTHAGFTISSHCGPGCMGVLFFRK